MVNPKITGFLFSLVVFALVFVALEACAPKTTAPPTAKATIASLAESGKHVYTLKCAGCHGDQGQGLTGPSIIGNFASLEKYGNAQALYDYVSASMPFSAPGSLSREEYLQVLSYLVLQNSFAASDHIVDPEGLGNLVLKK